MKRLLAWLLGSEIRKAYLRGYHNGMQVGIGKHRRDKSRQMREWQKRNWSRMPAEQKKARLEKMLTARHGKPVQVSLA